MLNIEKLHTTEKRSAILSVGFQNSSVIRLNLILLLLMYNIFGSLLKLHVLRLTIKCIEKYYLFNNKYVVIFNNYVELNKHVGISRNVRMLREAQIAVELFLP